MPLIHHFVDFLFGSANIKNVRSRAHAEMKKKNKHTELKLNEEKNNNKQIEYTNWSKVTHINDRQKKINVEIFQAQFTDNYWLVHSKVRQESIFPIFISMNVTNCHRLSDFSLFVVVVVVLLLKRSNEKCPLAKAPDRRFRFCSTNAIG